MKFLVGIIVALFLSLILTFKKVWAYLDLDPETCSFNTTSMLPEYKDPGTLQYFGKILENTGYTWRHSGQAMIIENELINPRAQKTYDTARDYNGSYMFILYEPVILGSAYALPHTIEPAFVYPRFQRLTTTYQPTAETFAYLEMRAVETGGFSIQNNSYYDAFRVTALIIELRKVAGV